MCRTKKFFQQLALFLLVATPLAAQSVKVKKENASVKGESLEGYAVAIDALAPEVNAALVKFVKPLGKIKQSYDLITVTEPTLNSIAYTQPVYAITRNNDGKATVWLGLRGADWTEGDAKAASKELEKLVYDFGVKFYRDKIQVQIDESNRAVVAVEKQQARLANEGKSLGTKLEDNKREKLQLEKSLEANKLENETLLQKIEKNKHAQDSIAVAAEQIRKVVEMHKEKQRKVN